MYKPLSEESKGLLRAMKESEAWQIYQNSEKEEISNLRVTAKFETSIEERTHYYDLAQGREDALTSINTLLQ